VYFVLSTHQGGDYLGQDTEGMLAQLASLNAQILLRQEGIWVFRLDPRPGAQPIRFAGASAGRGAWSFGSSAGTAVLDGPPSTWRIQGDARAGVVLWGDYWSEMAGTYAAAVNLAAAGPVTIQVTEPLTGRVLATESLIGSGARQEVQVPFSLPTSESKGASGLMGKGPLKIQSVPAPPSTLLEVLVTKTASTSISIYTVAVRSTA
jgi:hypothetical protein